MSKAKTLNTTSKSNLAAFSQKIALFLFSFVLCLFLIDGFLGWAGFPSEYVDDSVAYPPEFTQTIRWIDHTYQMQTNDQGIRYAKIPLQKPVGEKRILVIGDSITEGQGVESHETFCAILEKKSQRAGSNTRWINGGIAGAGPDEYASLLSRVGLKYQPDAVLVVLYTNDVENLPSADQRETNAWFSNDFLIPTQILPVRKGLRRWIHGFFPRTYTMLKKCWMLHARSRPADVIQETAQTAKKLGVPETKIRQWKNQISSQMEQRVNERYIPEPFITSPILEPDFWSRCIELNGPHAESKWTAFKGIFSKMIRLLTQKEIPVAFVFVPHPYHYDPTFDPLPVQLGLKVDPSWLTEETELEKRLASFFQKSGRSYLNLTPSFRRHVASGGAPLNFVQDAHLSAEGHRLVADRLWSWVEEIKHATPS